MVYPIQSSLFKLDKLNEFESFQCEVEVQQDHIHCLIIFFILITCLFGSECMFQEEVSCWSLLGLKALWYSFTGSQHAVPLLEKSDSTNSPEQNSPIPPPSPLELCCMSGCQNCVMIQHAEELMKMYDDDSAARAALEDIPDENLKTFLKMEMNLK